MANSQTFTLNIKALFDASDVKAKANEIQNAFKNIRLPDNLNKGLNDSFTTLNKALSDYESKVNKGIKTKTDAQGIMTSVDNIIKEFTKLENVAGKIKTELGNSVDLSKIVKFDDTTVQKINALRQQIAALQKDMESIAAKSGTALNDALEKIGTKGAKGAATKAIEVFNTGNIEQAIQLLEEAERKQQALLDARKHDKNNQPTEEFAFNEKTRASAEANIEIFTQMREIMASALTQNTSKTEELAGKTQELTGVIQNATNTAVEGVEKASQGLTEQKDKIVGVRGELENLTSAQAQFVKEVDQVKSRIQYFFGLANSINLVKRAIRGAVDTVKELDKAMTETAVVTDHTVSDMWAKLPEYTKRANELGVSTLAAYQSATLYYQQGLNDEQAAALSTETLKMARIAGLEAADATDRMTNALRGFNMELNSTDAQRVDDVYSQLAAMSASNVDEISTAMTKVASLAHSANMEFETTAAFLAQIIETTRESAETAGTALKTVVARFSEVKKLYDMDELKGKDEEGQNIDVNKVSSALRTAGIDLNKYFLGEVGLDDIFMELASKWDSLTSVQQRYIATQAAGSRQQSRFIALMQDYARTQQLVSAAYNANGASAKQFEKTQESLQSKLARLKNAWDAFLMGLANNAIIKGAVDLLTLLLNTVNNLTSAFGTGIGTILKWTAAISGFIGLRSAFGATGIATKAIGGLVGSTPIGNAIKFALGAVTKDKEGNFVPVESGARQPILFSTGGLFNRIGDKFRGFNSDALTNAQSYNAYKQMADEYMAINSGAANPYAQEMAYYSGTSKFALLGKKFYGTKVGSIARGSLAKLGVAGGEAAAVSGATALAATIGTITVAAGAAAIAIKAMYDATPQGQLKIAQKYADAMSTAANNTQKQVSELQKASRSIKEYDTALQKATTTSQRSQAIEDRNNYIQSLLEQNSRYAEYLTTTFEDGQMVLKLDIDASALDTAIKGANIAQAGSDFAQATVAGKQANIIRGRMSGVDLENRRYFDRTMTDAEVAQYTKYQSQINQYESQLNAYAQKAFSALIPTDQVSDEVAGLMSQALAEGFDDTELPSTTGWWLQTRSNWQNKYLQAYGTEADTNMSTHDIARAVAQFNSTQQHQGNIDQLTTLLTGASKDTYQALLEGFTGQGKLFTKNLLGLNVEEQGSIYDFLGLDISNTDEVINSLNKLADALDMTTADLVKGIQQRARAEKKAQQANAFNTSTQMFNSGISSSNIAKYLTLPNLEDQELFNNLYNSFDASFLSDELVTSLLTGIESGGSELTDWLKTIDLSNPIQSVNRLTEAAKNGTGEIQNTAQALLEAGNASQQFSASAQLGYFTTSESFDSLSDQLDKFIEENGKITADNIKELADANADLNDLLENNITSATGLAAVLTELQQGTINAWDLTDAIIAATAAMDDLDGIVAKTISDLNSFDPGYDENDVSKFINKVLDNATENIGKGATGNNQMRNYMEYIFGDFEYEGPEKGYGAAYEAWLNNNVDWLKANKDNMFSAWSDFAGTLTNKELKLFDDQGNVIHEAAKVWQKGEEIFIEANGMTTDQLIQAMVQTEKLTEQQARMMITDFKNYSSDFAHEMAMNDLPNAVQAWMDAVQERSGGLYDQNELDTLAKLLHVKSEDITAEIEKIQAASDKYKGIEFKGINFAETEGPNKGERTQKSITSALQEAGVTLTSDYTTDQERIIKGDELFDYDSIKAAYKKLGLPQMFENDFQTILGNNKEFYADFFGEQTKVSVGEGQTAGEAYAEAYQQAVNKDLASQMGEALTGALEEKGLEINITVSEEGIGQIELLRTTSDEAKTSVTDLNGQEIYVTATYDSVTALSGALSDIIGKLQTAQALASQGINANASLGGIFARGGIIDSYASGSENNHGHPGVALTGEEGAEIVWNKDKGYAYITGKHHPELQYLRPGDRIFNASETKKILGSSASSGMIPSFARGYGAANAAKKASGGGSGGSKGGGGSGKAEKEKTPEEWKNELDWLYNLMEDIAELERDQKAIEEQYEDYLADQTKTGGDLYRLLVQQLGNLYTQLNHQTFALEKREQEMREFMDVTNDKDQYLWYNWQDRTLEIDWDAIDRITDEEEYKHVKELVDEAEEIQDKIDDADDAIMDITNQIQELENIWRDTFTDFEDRVLDAIVKSYQQVIDKYSELNDTLNNSNTQILDSLQKQISLERQIRDNTKTEEEISDEEARLAYLRRDTSGGNDLAALQLEKELADQRESYEDTLVDQAINRLQEDNDAAAQQRERQIEIMQAQLDYQSENGEFNAYVRELLTSAMGADGELLTNSDLVALLKEQENWDAMSEVSKQVWDEELNGTFKEVAAFLLKENAEQNGTFYTALTEAVKTVSTAIGSYSQAMTKLGNQIASAGSSGGGDYSGGGGSSDGGYNPDTTPPPKPAQSISIGTVTGGANATLTTVAKAAETASRGYGTIAEYANQILRPSSGGSIHLPNGKTYKYATGGLADSTGLAWLDGTPSEPEYVLNARQTDAFLKLADVLPSMMSNGSSTTQNTFGATYVNLSVNLESVSPDYDVDRMVDLVKDKLYDVGSYRNVNSLSFLR